MKSVISTFILILSFSYAIAQVDSSAVKLLNNAFTTGLFMKKSQYEVKIFNNLYTEVAPSGNNIDVRNSFLTSFIQITIGSDRNINYGIDLLYKSNVMNDLAASSSFKVLNFEKGSERNFRQGTSITTTFDHGLSHVGGRIRTKPFKNKQFTFQQAVYAPAGGIDMGWIINSDLFFEYNTQNKLLMLFGDLGVWYNAKQQAFPYLKAFAGTLLAKRLSPYIMINLPYELGSGLKVFIGPQVELEFLYTWWLPWKWTVQDKRPQTFNLGLRFTNFNNFTGR